MSNYEYLGKKEIYKRVQALGYEMPKIKRAAAGAVASCPGIVPGAVVH